MIPKLLAATAFTLIGATAASAQVSIGVQIGRPVYGYVDPYYYPPPPPPVMVVQPPPPVVVVQPYGYGGYYYQPVPRGRAAGHYKNYYRPNKHYYKQGRKAYRGRGNWD